MPENNEPAVEALPLMQELVRVGALSPKATRVIIDLRAGQPIKLYAEQFGDRLVREVLMDAGLRLLRCSTVEDGV